MITEDYVSFQTAKLLKEKGFDAYCHSHYYPYYEDDTMKKKNYDRYRGTVNAKNKLYYEVYDRKGLMRDHYLCPTIQMAMKWLRAEKKLYINIWADPKDAEHNNFEIVYRMTVFSGNSNFGTHEFPSYEEAAEAGIKYCLEHLIVTDRDRMMEMPDKGVMSSLTFGLRYGREMHDEHYHAGETTWKFPNGIREKIIDDRLYRIWYKRHDPSDPSDMSVHYTVYYIEKTKKNEL